MAVYKIPEEDEPEKVPNFKRKIPTPVPGSGGKKPADPRRQQALFKKMSPHQLHMHHKNHVNHMKNKMPFKPR